ncbi:MAG: membrane protein insertion efficiency factor YidD [Betaproteobacteria bacterium]|jgi:putative membrane protein insertion efficiency factor|nr:membrane protein insertion efficiency factor YidD [Betaproteobacteria bacterium]NBP43778.1 membrane protein insertion efficiency factor YidD [Betaproteobacteria bacterium]
MKRLLILAVKAYRLLLSPWLGSSCRFEPTCSLYALQALQRHGAWQGTRLAGWRVLRCHPWCDGGCDPVPEKLGQTPFARPLISKETP